MSFRHIRNFRGFFSDYYLGSVFGRSSGRHKKHSDRETQIAYARFKRIRERAEGRAPDAASCREKFIRPMLRDVLGFHLGAGENRIHALFLSADAEIQGQMPLVLCYCGAWDEDLDSGRGAAQPLRRMEAALAQTGLLHGILLSGECARLMRASGEGPRGAYVEADLPGLAEEDDAESFAAMHRLFSASNFIADSAGKTPIDEIERESRRHAEKVSDDLKQAVFTAAESLVSGLIQDALASGRFPSALSLTETDLRVYRNAALLALYRILFILYAESRDPRLEEHQLYRKSYSAQGLVDEVVRDPERYWPENRFSLWQRLRALFQIYDQGLPAITPWENIPPRGGDFFSTRTPEGRIIDEARLPDSVVAQLMVDLAMTAPRRGVGREHVSFRELDIENLGSVYEGLLEYEPRLAQDTILEIRVQGRPFALSPADVVRLCEQKKLALSGDFALAANTVAETLHPQSPACETEVEDVPEEDTEETVESDDPNDESGDEEKGISTGGTAKLLRRLEAGSFHFVPGPGRKGSGSFYTPRPLVQDLVRHAIGPLIEGTTSAEIEKLRVLDPACGSAHFLVEAMRYLGQALHRSYVLEHATAAPPEFRSTTGQGWDVNWRASDAEARISNSEARAWCKRRIAERCLFGVDLNPTAVELARVALWIESVAGDRPLSYFEHHVRPGNSLMGSWMARLESPPVSAGAGNRRGSGPSQAMLPFQESIRAAIREAAKLRRLIDETRPEDLRREGIEPDSVKEQEFKDHVRRQADNALAVAKLLFDLRSASAFIPEIWHEWPVLCSQIGRFEDLSNYVNGRSWKNDFESVRERERFFHWELEYPEVFIGSDRPGFDIVLGNPPWDKVLPARTDFYARYDILIRAFTGNELDRRIRELQETNPGLIKEFDAYRERMTISATFLRNSGDFPYSKARSGAAHEDLSKYFLDRAARIARDGGLVGMLVPSVIYNGDGSVGLRRFLLHEASVQRFYGFENRAKIFPIDSRYKFVCLVFRKGESADADFRAAFMRHEMEELRTTAAYGEAGESVICESAAPWIVTMRRSEVETLSPETSAFLEYRSARDQEIVRKMYQGRPTLADEGPNSWQARFISWRSHEIVYNSAEDKDLWTDPQSGRLYSPALVLPDVPSDLGQTILKMRERGFWPVFEGKNTDQFLVATKPIRWWLSLEQVERKYGRLPRSEPTLVFRRIASNTNERTVLALVLPPQSAASEQLPAIISSNINPDIALQVLNSLCFDYLLRLRSTGSTLAFTYVRPLPVPEKGNIKRLPLLSTRLADGSAHITENHVLWPALWEMDRSVAEAYGLGPADFEHILSSFPVFARKRPEFHAYLRARLAEWADEAGEKLVQEYPRELSEKILERVAERNESGYDSNGSPPKA